MIILDGKKLSQKDTIFLKEKVNQFKIKPVFTIVQVGNLFSSNKYIKTKMDKALEIGVVSRLIKIPESISEKDLISIIEEESKISHGLIVQLPLPLQFDQSKILNSVPITKDIDGLSEKNSKNLYSGKSCIQPATARGIIDLIKEYNFTIKDKKVYVIGESNLVGKPIKELFKQAGAIVKSFNINTGIKGSEEADILIVAAGHPNLVKPENVKNNSIVIDVGINSIGENDKMIVTGDVDFSNVKTKVKAISPVPGGVGPMTVISLFKNLIEIFEKYLLDDN
ncbi:bifunctional 5,10-methylenetetrahydrofolate dehydrogenase/5,10-methenyltetrahydrofolate cyclohydrolase [[Mycoplasma] mobile]|uniref:Bifunctional protein FolD n=1 Tax=Mycoplasma mobile (strain ATCC 43663 / 163K / NCTC 11711) TaxID=267748 RepID=FOLD_MYCM1|nr:bifunctional 5,10-methylenetetrahydrofolate dehydrogenase/5,10-methenyltetrahydrofolate cyclohydrolase [[Mycoplasma] mobile]Q6KID0.1 RecName: Full=Bifunctional protein FolD; Includes: RecName: Full=Methylenetetrahydrofolate dehydrogenase; Includes: RecName: Full=Methenyltetrahydrofolate cyclohydrolase [Mycoplasma mobile 163K]AAT27646.1 methylenetetrahydrofolate dehydrogenase/methenyltetrahydrofolate cyclohydrolase [Mycoplasma mobile 163K]